MKRLSDYFKFYRHAWLVLLIALLLGLLVIEISPGFPGRSTQLAVLVLGALIPVAGIVWGIVYSRCPHCRGGLRLQAFEYCPHCGKKLPKWDDM